MMITVCEKRYTIKKIKKILCKIDNLTCGILKNKMF